jgi:hypothetical protein
LLYILPVFCSKAWLDAQRELKLLTESGLAKRVSQGGRLYYEANSDSPLYNEIKNLVIKGREAVEKHKYRQAG